MQVFSYWFSTMISSFLQLPQPCPLFVLGNGDTSLWRLWTIFICRPHMWTVLHTAHASGKEIYCTLWIVTIVLGDVDFAIQKADTTHQGSGGWKSMLSFIWVKILNIFMPWKNSFKVFIRYFEGLGFYDQDRILKPKIFIQVFSPSDQDLQLDPAFQELNFSEHLKNFFNVCVSPWAVRARVIFSL